MDPHADHTGHDVQVLVTERGLADFRGLSPKQRAKAVMENCARPDFKPALTNYYKRGLDQPAGRHTPGRHTPRLLGEVFDWHLRPLRDEAM